MAAKIAMVKGLNIEGIEAEDFSLGGAENVSLGLEDLDLRFIWLTSTLRELAGSSCNCPPSPSMPIDDLTLLISCGQLSVLSSQLLVCFCVNYHVLIDYLPLYVSGLGDFQVELTAGKSVGADVNDGLGVAALALLLPSSQPEPVVRENLHGSRGQ